VRSVVQFVFIFHPQGDYIDLQEQPDGKQQFPHDVRDSLHKHHKHPQGVKTAQLSGKMPIWKQWSARQWTNELKTGHSEEESMILHGRVRGCTIELTESSGLADGQEVEVSV